MDINCIWRSGSVRKLRQPIIAWKLAEQSDWKCFIVLHGNKIKFFSQIFNFPTYPTREYFIKCFTYLHFNMFLFCFLIVSNKLAATKKLTLKNFSEWNFWVIFMDLFEFIKWNFSRLGFCFAIRSINIFLKGQEFYGEFVKIWLWLKGEGNWIEKGVVFERSLLVA